MKSILLIKIFWGVVEMTFGLVNASFNFPRMASFKNDFLCTLGFVASMHVLSFAVIGHDKINIPEIFQVVTVFLVAL